MMTSRDLTLTLQFKKSKFSKLEISTSPYSLQFYYLGDGSWERLLEDSKIHNYDILFHTRDSSSSYVTTTFDTELDMLAFRLRFHVEVIDWSTYE